MKILIFNDGLTKEVTDEQFEKILMESCTKNRHMYLNGDLIAFSNIARTMDAEEYYMQSEKERDQFLNYTVKKDELKYMPEVKLSDEKLKERTERRRQKILNGLNNFIQRAEESADRCYKARKLIEFIQNKEHAYTEKLIS